MKSKAEMGEEVLAAIPTLKAMLHRRPTYEEIAKAVGYKSKASVHDRISELEEQGRLARNFFGPETIRT
jgi:SOS-response transcriptional repressor LexA